MRKLLYVIVAAALCLLLSSACGHKDKGTLVIYAGLYEDHAIKAIETFEKQTGIKVSYVRLSAGEVLERIRQNKDNPVASIWFGGTADTFVQAKAEGLLEPYISKNAQMIDAPYKDPEGYWTGIYIGSIAFVSNKTWLHQTGLSAPQSWEDLLKPEYRGMLAMGDPYSSGTGYTTLATIIQLMGEEEGFRYISKLNAQNMAYTHSGSLSGRAAANGTAGTSIAFSHDAVKFYKEGFNNLAISFPKEGTGYEIGAVAMIKNGPDEEEARTFIDWSLTQQAQELGKQVGNYQLLTHRDAQSPAEAFPLESLNVIPYDVNWAGLNRVRLLEKWRSTISE